ncbi:arylsulfatase A-like enzyme [Haloferula luteola]|uniref:Arylsulfatase A-like enzyme n=1 Tax=Haloferula luteola TaxID=595692 RepID=A0A840UWQ4_9BACT|nr:sulfatase-like hydrolase/transferase [Haloferula luteola]MBB5350155.1 arylsulfatase A-like enzyme [Haloferula luteola]
MTSRILLALLTFSLMLGARAERPNIVLMLCDDLGYGDLGTFFQNSRARKAQRDEPWLLTPGIDAMAASGIRLPGLYCPAPVCAPSRASLLTGVHQGHAPIRDNQFDKALPDHITLASMLRQAGYATAAVGKWGLQGKSGPQLGDWPAYPTRRGFDFFMGYVRHQDGHEHYPKEGLYGGPKEVWENDAEISATLDRCYTTDLFTARAKSWMAQTHQSAPNQPFFLYLAFDTPHAVLELPTGPYPPGSGLHGGLQWLGQPGHMINTAQGTPDHYLEPDLANATWDHDSNPNTPEEPWPDAYRRYAASVRRIDRAVTDLLQTLDDLGIGNNTLVVFTTDNGPSQESYLKGQPYEADFFNSFGPFDGIKRDCLEGGLRVGGIARWLGKIPPNLTDTAPCQFHDWMPTFADAAGIPSPARSDGVSLLPRLTGHGTPQPSTIYSEYHVDSRTPAYPEFAASRRGQKRGHMQMIRIGNHVGLRYRIQSHNDPFEIYDILHDPGQRHDLSSQLPELQQEMHDAVLRLRRPNPSAPRPYDDVPIPALELHAQPGLSRSLFPGKFPWVPDFSPLTPSHSGTSEIPQAEPTENDLGILHTGFLHAPESGEYAFRLRSDSGALLRLHRMILLENAGNPSKAASTSSKVHLAAGDHPLQLSSIHRAGVAPQLSLEWKPPGTKAFVAIPADAFGHTPHLPFPAPHKRE